MQRLMRLLELELMQKVIAHLLRLPVAFFDRQHRGDIVDSVRHDVSKTRAAATSIIEIGIHGTHAVAYLGSALRSEERRVGKRVDHRSSGGMIEKKARVGESG